MPSCSLTPSERVYHEICGSYYESGTPPTLREIAERLDRHPATVGFHCENLRSQGLLNDGGGAKHRSLVPRGPEARFARFTGEVLTLLELGHPVTEIADSFGVLPSLIYSVRRLFDRATDELPG